MVEAALGAVLGLGLWMVVDRAPLRSLVARLAPHLRDVGGVSGRVPRGIDLYGVVRVLAPNPFRSSRDLWSIRGTARRRAIDAEISAVLDRAALCLSAGLGIVAMVERVGSDATGILGGECRLVARELSAGTPLGDALAASEHRIRHEGWSRFVEHLVTARRHGTPVAATIRALATEERAAAGRRLIESASARETYMLLPLVFVILPMTVLVAVFPGLVALATLPL